jgi:tRNA pseudouridine13 synthase
MPAELASRPEPGSVVAELPTITPELSGIEGEIKAVPSHFVVVEIPLYEATGEGEHVYVSLTREGQTTRDLQQGLARLFDVRPFDIGTAGLKDKQARATQTFSLPLPQADETEVSRQISAELPAEVNWVRRHRNKLKPGHLLGNRFHIVVLTTDPDALERTHRIADTLTARGLPNFYGPQRFGTDGTNADRGRETLLGRGPRQRWLRRILLSALQAALFNRWLAERIERDWFARLLRGDIAKKTDTGGIFVVQDPVAEQPRLDRGEITYTGPIYGTKMRWSAGEPGALERCILDEAEIDESMLKQARLGGSRRPARLLVDDLEITPHPQGLLFAFSLPKGAYATTLLREFLKGSQFTLPEDDAE